MADMHVSHFTIVSCQEMQVKTHLLFPFTVLSGYHQEHKGMVLASVILAKRRLTVTASFATCVQCMGVGGSRGGGTEPSPTNCSESTCMCNTYTKAQGFQQATDRASGAVQPYLSYP